MLKSEGNWLSGTTPEPCTVNHYLLRASVNEFMLCLKAASQTKQWECLCHVKDDARWCVYQWKSIDQHILSLLQCLGCLLDAERLHRWETLPEMTFSCYHSNKGLKKGSLSMRCNLFIKRSSVDIMLFLWNAKCINFIIVWEYWICVLYM